MTDIIVADIGGTNARFARAAISAGTVSLSEPCVLATADYPNLAAAFEAFLARSPGPEPSGAALALAGPVSGTSFKLTNAHWTFDPAALPDQLGLANLTLLNDFAAIAHAVAGDAQEAHLEHVHGPATPMPRGGETVTIIGPGTGLGIAHYRIHDGTPIIQATEGAHIDFAPVDEIDDAMLAALRGAYDRVSLERVVSGQGIVAIAATIAELEGREPPGRSAIELWQAGIAGNDPIAARAVQHFVKTLGRAAGDYALAHGANAVVIAGGIGERLSAQIAQADFHAAFLAKGRYRTMMEGIAIKRVTAEQPGLLGAAYAFSAQYGASP
ncbi:MAG: ROK family protein [Pseudomonadota bacterium]